MMKEKLGISQYELMPIFGVDQSTISRHLEFARTILLEILPTAEKIAKKIQNAKSIEEIRHLVPGGNGGELYIDGTHISIERPTDPDAIKDYYSGNKKKAHYKHHHSGQSRQAGYYDGKTDAGIDAGS